MMIVLLRGGLGNQLYLAAYILHQLTHKRIVIAIFSPKSLHSPHKNANFDLRPITGVYVVGWHPWKQAIFSSVSMLFSRLLSSILYFVYRKLPFSRRLIYCGYAQDVPITKTCVNTILNLLSSQARADGDSISLDKRSLMLQLRIGDYLSKSNSSLYHLVDQDWVISSIRSQFMVSTIEMILVTTDNPDFVRQNFIPSIRAICHEDNITIKILDHKMAPIDVMLIMARSENLIVSNSTFGLWGSFFSSLLHPSPNILAPLVYYKNSDSYPSIPEFCTVIRQ